MDYCCSSSRLKALDPEVIKHPWLKESGEASDKPIDGAVIFRVKQFRAMNKLKKLALKSVEDSI
ncbi:hypothetical protein WN943_002053 [Citrus x changshan-huyou]